MTTERYINEDGVVVDTEVLPDELREVVVGRVTSLSPPMAKIPSRPDPIRVHARTVGLTVAVNDLVLLCRVEQGVVAISKVEVL